MHCLDYLWQTLLCHADVSVMSLEYNDEQQAFNANFDVIKQCRDFDVYMTGRKREKLNTNHLDRTDHRPVFCIVLALQSLMESNCCALSPSGHNKERK